MAGMHDLLGLGVSDPSLNNLLDAAGEGREVWPVHSTGLTYYHFKRTYRTLVCRQIQQIFMDHSFFGVVDKELKLVSGPKFMLFTLSTGSHTTIKK